MWCSQSAGGFPKGTLCCWSFWGLPAGDGRFVWALLALCWSLLGSFGDLSGHPVHQQMLKQLPRTVGVSRLKLYPGLSPAPWLSRPWGHAWLTLWAVDTAAEGAWYWDKLKRFNLGFPVLFSLKIPAVYYTASNIPATHAAAGSC